MSEIKMKNLTTLSNFLQNNNFDSVSEFITTFIDSNNKNIDILTSSYVFDKSTDSKLVYYFILYIQLIEELIYFINLLLPITNENDQETHKNIDIIFQDFNIKITYKDALIKLFKDIIPSFKKKNLSNSLISYDWQLSVIDRQKDKQFTNNKLDKVEISLQVKSHDNNTEDAKNSLLKMNYYEFYEIFQNLKKIDGQLHLFKNQK